MAHETLRQAIESRNGRLQVHQVDDTLVGSFFTTGHLSKAAYYRLLIGSLLPESVTRAVYLDTDLVVLRDIEELFEISLDGKTVGAVPDHGILDFPKSWNQKEQTLGLKAGDSYFNSGVMLFDLVQWREKGYEQRLLEEAAHHKYRHHDQDALNHILYGDWKALPLEWNVIPPLFLLGLKMLLNGRTRRTAGRLHPPAILHWAGRKKPWQYRVYPPFNGYYWTYADKTGFSESSASQRALPYRKRIDVGLAQYFYGKDIR